MTDSQPGRIEMVRAVFAAFAALLRDGWRAYLVAVVGTIGMVAALLAVEQMALPAVVALPLMLAVIVVGTPVVVALTIYELDKKL